MVHWRSRCADAPRCEHFSIHFTPSWIRQKISVGKCTHRGAWARRERQTMFPIVTWTKQTWINNECTLKLILSFFICCKLGFKNETFLQMYLQLKLKYKPYMHQKVAPVLNCVSIILDGNLGCVPVPQLERWRWPVILWPPVLAGTYTWPKPSHHGTFGKALGAHLERLRNIIHVH